MTNGSWVRKAIRLAWTVVTYVLLFPPCIVAGIVGALFGLVAGFFRPRGPWYELKANALNTVIRVAGFCLKASTGLYNRIFKHQFYQAVPLPRLTHDFWVVGHRGAPYCRCENTLASFQRAIREGANALEIDLSFTQDGTVVLWHDWDPDSSASLFREGGSEDNQLFRPVFPDPPHRKKVTRLTLQELRDHYTFAPRGSLRARRPMDTHIITFKEFTAWAAQQKELHAVFLDIKIPPTDLEYVAPMMQAIREEIEAACPGYLHLAMTIYPEVYEAMRKVQPDMAYCFDHEIYEPFLDATPESAKKYSSIMTAERLGNKYASVGRPTFLTLAPWEVYESVVRHDLEYRHAKQLDIALIAWTINDPDEWKWLTESGVDGILTDYPGKLAKKALRRKAVQLVKSPLRALRNR